MIDNIRDYKIIKKIGEGGMGTVYLASDTMLERNVAIKVLNPILTKDSQFTDRFRHEAKVQASLIHPNIVTLYNYFREGDNYCMVMEYVEGVTVKQLISNTGPLPEQKAVWVLNQILEAVGYAHKKGIIHRDIKPSNILLTNDNTVKILDFGIAKILQDKGLTKTGTKMGTIYYMSPEQIKAVKDIDNRTDIYSIGVTLYEMLSGRIPFNVDTDSDFEIMNEIVTGEIKDPRKFYPHISDWLVDILFASVEKDRSKRIQSTDEFTKRLLSKEGKAAVTGVAEKTIIETPKSEIKEQPKTVVAPPSAPPIQPKPKPLKQGKTVKPKSSNKKIFMFGGIGLIAAVIIYFVATSNSDPDPYGPSDPISDEDSITVIDEPYVNNNLNIESDSKRGTAKADGRTRRYGPGIPAQAELTYPAY
jgi:serine/threonine protein kinase